MRHPDPVTHRRDSETLDIWDPGLLNPETLERIRRQAEEAADLLKAVGSPNRLMLLCYLLERPRSVGELSELVGMRQSLTSQHLARLRADNLVSFERRDQTLIYSVQNQLVKNLLMLLCQHYARST